MFKYFSTALAISLVPLSSQLGFAQEAAAPSVSEYLDYVPETFAERYSYTHGSQQATWFLDGPISLDLNAFLTGLNNAGGMEDDTALFSYRLQAATDLSSLKTEMRVKDVAPDPERIEKLSKQLSFAAGQALYFDMKDVGLEPDLTAALYGLADGSNHNRKTRLFDIKKDVFPEYKSLYAQQNLIRSEDYLSQLSSEPGIVTAPSGLRYRVIKAGQGEPPTFDDKVSVYYAAWSVNESDIWSADRPGPPQILPISAMIPGWQEALLKMKPGAVWNVHLPPALAYGQRGLNRVQSNDALSFTIELVEVVED